MRFRLQFLPGNDPLCPPLSGAQCFGPSCARQPAAAAPSPPAACSLCPCPRRNSQSPRRLVDTFPPPHDDIHTLYDVLESSVAQYGDVSRRGSVATIVAWSGSVWCGGWRAADPKGALERGLLQLGGASGAVQPWRLLVGCCQPAGSASSFLAAWQQCSLSHWLHVLLPPPMQSPYLGHRLSDAKGQPGPYVWQTYAECGEIRRCAQQAQQAQQHSRGTLCMPAVAACALRMCNGPRPLFLRAVAHWLNSKPPTHTAGRSLPSQRHWIGHGAPGHRPRQHSGPVLR